MPPAIDLARRFAEAIIALRAIHEFDAWIGQFWCEHCPAPGSSAAHTDAGADDAIVWHDGDATIYGFLPDRNGCFCIPREAPLPEFAFTAGRAAPPYGQDIVISAGMRDELQPPGA